MAILEIEGQKVEVDDSFLSMSPEEQSTAVDEIGAMIGIQGQSQPPQDPEALANRAVQADLGAAPAAGLSPALEEGASLGFRGEAKGAARAVGQVGRNLISLATGDGEIGGIGDAFRSGVAESDAEVAQSIEENPILGRAVEAVGGLGASGVGKLTAAAGSSLFARIAAAAKEGGTFGGLFGLGTSEGDLTTLEGAGERAIDTAKGIGIGAGTGGALPLAVKGVQVASAPVRAAIGALRPGASAQAKVVEALARDNVTPAQATARLRRAEAAEVPQALVDVAGSNTTRLARASRTVPGPGSEKIDSFLVARQLNQPDRVLETVQRTLGADDVFRVADDIVAERSALANRMYTEAFETAKPVDTTFLTNNIKKGLETAVGKTASSLKKLNKDLAGKNSVEALHAVKTELDDTIAAAKRAGRNNQVRVLSEAKNRMLAALKKASPEYDQARQVFSSLSDNVDALTAGQKFLNKDARLTTRDLAKLTDGEKEFFRLGASEALAKKINSAQDGASIARRIFGNKAQRDKLRAVFPNDRSFREFQATMLREARTTETNQFVRGGSPSVDKAAELADAGAEGVVKDLARGDIVGATTRGVGTALNIAKGITPRTADQIADILTSTDPKVVETIMEALQKRAAASQAATDVVNTGISLGTRASGVSAN